MLIWKNTSILNSFENGLIFTEQKDRADIVLMGSQSINLNEFNNLKGIFRAGISNDNVPEKQAKENGIIIRYPTQKTMDIIFQETASFTCSMIFRMMYDNSGSVKSWIKPSRKQLFKKSLLVIGTGRIGHRVEKMMQRFMKVQTFDIKDNVYSELKPMIEGADCLTIHIPNNDNSTFIDSEKLSWMKDDACIINTARGRIVDEESLFLEFKKGRLKAAFDVFWEEPYYGKLKEFCPNRFFMTPHIASSCNEFMENCRKELDELIGEISA